MTTILQQSLSSKLPIHFMPTAISDEAKYINGVFTYILRISGYLINRQKAIINVIGIKPFFDVVVPEETSLPTFKTRLVNILSNTLKGTSKFGIEHISTFPLQGYYIEKKLYGLREVGISTASDELNPTYYYRKVTLYVNIYNPISEDNYNNPLFFSALSQDRTLILTYDIETYSSRKMGDVSNAKYEEDIKDDPEPLKQICLVDIETAPDPRLITIISKKLGVLEWMFNHMSIKPSAIDVRPCFMRFHPKAERSSLAFYLNESGLKSKLDMPIHHINKYYEKALNETNATTAKQIRERNAINEYKEVASVAFISLYDSHYFAVGMKVRNLPCKQMETGKFPGTYVFSPVKGLENKRSVTGLDFALLYPCLIITYNLSPDKIILSRECTESLKESKHRNQAEMKGLYPKVLEELRIRRNSLKSRLALLNDKKKELEKKINLTEERGIVVTNTLKSEYSSVVFNIACLDAKQFALKVYMNTFYGEAGNSRSLFFLRALAGGVISAGQRNIKLITNLIRTYNNGNGILKEEYWSRMVNISIEVIERFHNEVNDFLRNDNGSFYLKRSYEKVLFLVVFIGKKKYYGKKVMDKSMKVDNSRTLYQIVKDVLKEIINDILQIDLNGMVKTAMWKPDKNNKSVQYFISRMQDRHTYEKADAKQYIKKGLTPKPYLYEIPESGECFKYIVVENDSSQR
ncbi:13892_t:CDS:10, partial [Funneliformis geosporum]